MKGFAKVFFLVTMLFAVTSLFASVHKQESVKHPPGYSMCIDVQVSAVDLQNTVVVNRFAVVQECDANESIKAEVACTVVAKPDVVQLEPFTRKTDSFNIYTTKETEPVTISEAEALPDRTV